MNGIRVCVQEIEKVRDGVAALIKNVWRSAVSDFRYVSSRTLWVKFKFSRVKVCKVLVYDPTEGEVKESEWFWNFLDKGVDRVTNEYRLCVLGDGNEWVGG